MGLKTGSGQSFATRWSATSRNQQHVATNRSKTEGLVQIVGTACNRTIRFHNNTFVTPLVIARPSCLDWLNDSRSQTLWGTSVLKPSVPKPAAIWHNQSFAAASKICDYDLQQWIQTTATCISATFCNSLISLRISQYPGITSRS